MSEWIRTLWNGTLFRGPAFSGLNERRDAFLQGLLIVLVIGLLVGLPGLIGDVVAGLRPNAIEAEMDKAMSEIDQVVQQMQPFLGNMPSGELEGIIAQVKEYMRFGFDIAQKVEAMPTILPKPIDRVFQAIGEWASKPFAGSSFPLGAAVLGTWLGYGIWVMLFAKLLGGRGTLAGFFGATALYAVPHTLSFFAFVPVLGGILGFLAYFWGLAIYVKGTSVSHQLSIERALLAVLLPALIALLVAIVGATGLATLIAISASGAR
jgi:hypothetical protein